MRSLLEELWNTVVIVWRIGNRWLRIAISLAILWPAVIILYAVGLPPSVERTATISFVALLPLVALFAIAMNAPLLWVAVVTIPRGRRILLWFLGFVGLELLTGVYLAFVPVSNEPNLVLPLILVIITVTLLKVAGWVPRIKSILVLLAIGITLVFFFGGWGKTKEKASAIQLPSITALNPYPGYNADRICKNLWEEDEVGVNDHQGEDLHYFDVVLKGDGCFGAEGHVRPPNNWVSWRRDWVSDEPDRHVGVWFSGSERSIGPFGPNLPPSNDPRFQYRVAEWTLQGKGTLRYTRIQ